MRVLAVRNAGVTISTQWLSLLIQVVATFVLARLLTPADFGVVAMVSTFSLLLVNFGLNGFTEAIIQSEDITHLAASNLFWINIGFGVVLTIVLGAAGSLLARFFGNPLVEGIAAGTSLSIFFTSTAVLHLALLKRAMRFTASSFNDVVGRAVSIGVSIVLALSGWGYWALVAGVVAGPISVTLGAWWLCRWAPSLPKRAPGTGALVRFALKVYGRFCLQYWSRNLDKVLVGWQFNAISLGFYKKAYDLFALSESQLTGPLHNVALATLSRLNRDLVQFKRYLSQAMTVLAFAGMGLGGVFTLTGRDVIRLVLGPQWSESGKIFSLFGPGIGVMLLYSTCGWIHLSIGKPGRWLRWSALELTVTVLLFFLGLHWGAEGVAAAWSASFWILIIPAFWYAGRPIRFGISDFLAPVWKFIAASLGATWATAAICRSMPWLITAAREWAALRGAIIISAMFCFLYISIVTILHRGLAPLRLMADLVRDILPHNRIPELELERLAEVQPQ